MGVGTFFPGESYDFTKTLDIVEGFDVEGPLKLIMSAISSPTTGTVTKPLT
jgi:hypothetical protein